MVLDEEVSIVEDEDNTWISRSSTHGAPVVEP